LSPEPAAIDFSQPLVYIALMEAKGKGGGRVADNLNKSQKTKTKKTGRP
jgi:hypothetical protein